MLKTLVYLTTLFPVMTMDLTMMVIAFSLMAYLVYRMRLKAVPVRVLHVQYKRQLVRAVEFRNNKPHRVKRLKRNFSAKNSRH